MRPVGILGGMGPQWTVFPMQRVIAALAVIRAVKARGRRNEVGADFFALAWPQAARSEILLVACNGMSQLARALAVECLSLFDGLECLTDAIVAFA